VITKTFLIGNLDRNY